MTNFLRFLISDEQILNSIRKGDDSVLSYLYEKNVRMIMKYIIQNNGNEADARVILQDALVIFWEKARKNDFILKSKISTYLYAVAKKKWLQELTYRKKHTTLEQISNNPGESAGIDDKLEENELSVIVKKCMGQLSVLCQQILTAFYYDEKSMQEISTLLGLANEDVAKSKKYQCKKELERLVKKIVG
jgi:RNA polymerase sigma factor (sigma-70 family)